MAARKKAKSTRRAKAKKPKRSANRAMSAKKPAKKATRRKSVARKRAAPKRAAPKRARRTEKQPQRPTQVPTTETVVVDTVEQPAPGVVVVTETQYSVRTDEA
jgi:hypothetical protein